MIQSHTQYLIPVCIKKASGHTTHILWNQESRFKSKRAAFGYLPYLRSQQKF